jgi:Flp pilus assembly protein CpaB
MSTLVLEVSLFMVIGAALLVAIGTYYAAQRKVLPLMLLGSAAAALLIAAWVTSYLALKKKEREVKAGWNLSPVLVATRDLTAGTPLTSDAVTTKSIPEQFATDSVFNPRTQEKALGRTLVVPVKRGEPITRSTVGYELAGCR